MANAREALVCGDSFGGDRNLRADVSLSLDKVDGGRAVLDCSSGALCVRLFYLKEMAGG